MPKQITTIYLADDILKQVNILAGERNRSAWIEGAIKEKLSTTSETSEKSIEGFGKMLEVLNKASELFREAYNSAQEQTRILESMARHNDFKNFEALIKSVYEKLDTIATAWNEFMLPILKVTSVALSEQIKELLNRDQDVKLRKLVLE